MTTLYLTVENATNIIQSASYAPPSVVDADHTLVGIDDSAPNAQAVQLRPTDYSFSNGAIVRRPYFTLSYDGSTVSATLVGGPSTPPTVTFAICGQSITATPTTVNIPATDTEPATTQVVATVAISVHVSVKSATVTVNVSADNFVPTSLNIGGQSAPTIALQAYQPTGSTNWVVAPSGTGSKSYLEAYYALSPASIASLLADIGTAVNLLFDTVFNVILPTANPTLTVNQQSTVNDVKTNVLPNVYTTLENANPNNVRQVQYSHLVADMEKTYAAYEQYMTDLQNIPNLA